MYNKVVASSNIESIQELLQNQKLFGCYISDFSGNIRYVNQKLASMLGYDSPEEMLTKNADALFADHHDRTTLITQLTTTKEKEFKKNEFLLKNQIR